ncbi:MAG: ChaN family lipoprotein [Myxococcota bacterium]
MTPGVYAVQSGDRIEPEAFFERVADAKFVVVGEQHDRAWHHEVQSKVFAAMIERHDNPVAIGMEMFQHPYQPALTAYVSGDIDEASMLEETEYRSRWGFDTEFYSPLWRAAREHRVPIVALNAPRELSRKIAEVGVDGLSEKQKDGLPQMDMDNEIQREYVRKAFAAHGMGMDDAKFERFYQAQVLWDETMAQTAVDFMSSHPHIEAMMIVAGVAHADERFGIPPRIERRLAEADVLTLRPVTHEELTKGVTSLEVLSEQESFDYIWVGDE